MVFARPLRPALLRAHPAVRTMFAVTAAFATYFTMYGVRKPFAAAEFAGYEVSFLGGMFGLKTLLVVSQIVGYATAKFGGVKFCSEARREQRGWLLIAMIAWAEAALVLFAIVPPSWKPVALFLNGMPLGMVWGLVVQYLEGRRTSDLLLSGLCCSFILASGVVKDVGLGLMAPLGPGRPGYLSWLPQFDEFWMPAVAGALFLPLFLISAWLLDQVPDPDAADVAQRTERRPMDAAARRAFLRRYWPGLTALVAAYFLLTAFRDVRDNYMVDVLNELGGEQATAKAAISRMEFFVSLVVLASMSALVLVRDNLISLRLTFLAMAAGFALIGGATWLHAEGRLGAYWWIALLGVGAYLAYVPYNAMLFDRLFAATHTVGTAVFAIYVADSAAYIGSLGTVLAKDRLREIVTPAEFLAHLAYVVSGVSLLALAAGATYFLRHAELHDESTR